MSSSPCTRSANKPGPTSPSTVLSTAQSGKRWPRCNTRPPGTDGSPPAASAPFDTFVRVERWALTPWLGSSAYFNYADPSIIDYPTAYWGDNVPRLQQVKRSYDPHNVFSFPQSVPL